MIDDGLGNPDSVYASNGQWVFRRNRHDCTYPMGSDPVWGISSNKMVVVNNMKMKLSVIFGIIHMSIGIIIKAMNNIYFKDYPSLFTEAIPGLIILLGLFGWMDILIIGKWLSFIDIEDDSPYTGLENGKLITKKIESDSLDPADNEAPISVGDWQNQHAPSVINLMIDLFFNFGKPRDPHYTPYIGDDI